MNILIFGLGLHGGGVGISNYFLKKGESVTITDLKSKEELKKSLEKLYKYGKIKLTLGKHSYEDIKHADLVIKNPAVPPDSPYIKYAQKLSIPVDTDIGIFLNIISSKTKNIIAVTGTRGKSTTTALVYNIVRRAFKDVLIAGNITISVFDVIDKVINNTWVILELSSFQLGGISQKHYSPPYALFTNLFQDHLNYYKDMKQYFEDKRVIYKFQKPGDILVLNRENAVYTMIKPNRGVKLYSFGFNADFNGYGGYLDKEIICFKDRGGNKEIVEKNSIKLKGKHNLLNIIAAVTLTSSIGIDVSIIRDAISNFKGLEHRLEFVSKKNGIEIYNDSASTTPDSLISALESFRGKDITLITGGTDKSLALDNLIELLNKNIDVKNLILLEGSGTKRLINEGLTKPYRLFNNFSQAIQKAIDVSIPGMILLFSPAFASFEMFLNEFNRGRKFKELVKSLL